MPLAAVVIGKLNEGVLKKQSKAELQILHRVEATEWKSQKPEAADLGGGRCRRRGYNTVNTGSVRR